MDETCKNQLKRLLGENVHFQGESTMDAHTYESYGRDYTKKIKPNFSALVFPKTEEEVVSIVKIALEHKISIVPSGGRTGLSGAALAYNGEIVLSMEKLNRFLELDSFSKTARVQAGMITKEIHRKVEEQGFYFPVDFAASGSSHIGGNIATNMGGIRVLRYGLLRNWILGLNVVTGKGELLRFNGKVLKNNTGYDLKQLFIASEGTLGIITEATLALTTIPKESRSILLATKDFKAILEVFKQTHNCNINLLAFEMFSNQCLKIVTESLSLKQPFSENFPYYALIEFELESKDSEGKIFEFVEKISEKELIEDGIISENTKQNLDFWMYREGIGEALFTNYTVEKQDISIPLKSMNDFINHFNELLEKKYPNFVSVIFGHIGDGNLHINLLKPKSLSSELFFEKCQLLNKEMFELIKSYEGSISAEHGIGILKKDFLHYSRTKEEIDIMKSIKATFDPYNIINTGKIF